jgi:hypothetical protein
MIDLFEAAVSFNFCYYHIIKTLAHTDGVEKSAWAVV